jgi:hypothetical protein
MLIRRIAKSLGRQDWAAASIEVVIVMLGIFLGLQASSWYEGEQERALEAELLVKLQNEFEEIQAEADSAVDTHQTIIEGLVKLDEALRGGDLRNANRNAVSYSLSNVLNADTGAGNSSTYTEIISSGRLRILSDDRLVSLLAEYDERAMQSQPLFTHFRLMQMQYEKDFHRHVKFGLPAPFDPRGFSTASVTEFEFENMRNDAAFRQALSRMTAFQTYFQLWHWQSYTAATAVLDHLAGASQGKTENIH